MKKYQLIILSVLFINIIKTQAQENVSLPKLIEMAKQNNLDLTTASISVNKAEIMTKTAFNLDKTEISYAYDPTNIDENNGAPYKQFSVSQSFKFPSYYAAKKKMLKSEHKMQEHLKTMEIVKIEKEISQAYQQLLFLSQKKQNLQFLDSLYGKFYKNAQRKYELGESNMLEKLTAQSNSKKINLNLLKIETDIQQINQKIKLLVGLKKDNTLSIDIILMKKLKVRNMSINETPIIKYLLESVSQKHYVSKMQNRSLLPDFNVGYTYGNNFLMNGGSFNAYQFGINIPLFSGTFTRRRAAGLEKTRRFSIAKSVSEKLTVKLTNLQLALKNNKQNLQYFEVEGRQLSKQIYQTANKSFKAGEINYFQYIQALENAKEMENEYLENLLQYNFNVLEINYLTND